MNRQNRVGCTQLRALVNHLLRAALDLGVAALHRIKVELSGIGTRGHGAGSTAAHADAHTGATQLNQQSASRKQDFFCQGSVNGAQAACDHDGLVVTPALAVHGLLVLAKVTRQVGPAEFIVEGGAAQRAVGHDLQRAGDVAWLAECIVKQPRDRETCQAGLGLGAAAGSALIPNFTAGARRGAGKR